MSTASSANDAPPVPFDVWRKPARCLYELGLAGRLAMLDVLARRGPTSLADASHAAGLGCSRAVPAARALERLGLISVTRIDGFNLGAVCEITPSGRRALEFAGMWAD